MRYIVECFNDECLLASYGIDPFLDIDHNINQGKGVVLNKLSNSKNKIGFIDLDKGIEHKYFDTFVLKETISDTISLYYDSENKNNLVVFNKKIETMFVKEIEYTDSLSTCIKLGFESTEKHFHGIGSSKERLGKLKSLLSTIVQRSENLQKLKSHIL